jgi:HEAT repeat protein
MHVRISIVLIVAICLFTSGLFAPRAISATDGRLETVSEALRRHNIEHTEPALVAALQNQDPEVRELAARALADDGAKHTIPSIKDALSTETVPTNQANIAFSLARLGEEGGRETLKKMCSDATEPEWLRMLAAVNMRSLNDDSCLPSIMQVLQSRGNPDGRKQALYLVPSFSHLPAQSFRPLLDLVEKELSDPESGVRMTASSVLGQIGDVSAIPYLRKAIAREYNEGCREQMRMDLKNLEKREH